MLQEHFGFKIRLSSWHAFPKLDWEIPRERRTGVIRSVAGARADGRRTKRVADMTHIVAQWT